VKFYGLALSAGIACLVSVPVSAQTQLKLADTMPAGHTIHREVTDLFMKEVERLSGGEVVLQHYPGGQLGKGTDSLRLIQTGLQDIGLISPSHVSDKMPLTAVGELPGLWTTACEAALAFWEMSREGGILHEQEYAPNGIRALVFFPLPGYQLMVSSDRQVNGLADIGGLKLRTTGGALERIVRSLGGVSVRMTAPEMYEAMSRGTIDGALFSYQAATSYKLTDLIRVSTENQNFGTVVNAYFISEQKWQSLDESVSKAIEEAGERATKEGCKGLDAAEQKAREELAAGGTRFIKLGDEDQARVDAGNEDVQDEWAKDLDQRSRPGTDVLTVFKTTLASPAH
jgi:TRAP-type C4-dicarboxylate transport system substrate-binding protein